MIDKVDNLLVIVESPNKAKTITSILKNAGYKHCKVVASIGHIIKLGDGGSTFNSGIYPEQNFKLNLEIAPNKQKVVKTINNLAENADKIIIMTNDNREGHLISWSLLKFCKLPTEKCLRVVVHEITDRAVLKAINNPIPFNTAMAEAGLTRIMIDKLIGYGLSPLAKKYLGTKSIGRCQSIGLKLVVDREKEIEDFIPERYFDVYLNIKKDGQSYQAKYIGYNGEPFNKFSSQADVKAIVKHCENSSYTIESLSTNIYKENPKLPFCTATFQQEAAEKLGLRVKDAMKLAQRLFEGLRINKVYTGLITHIYTDSQSMNEDFVDGELKSYIENTYGKNYFKGVCKAKKYNLSQGGHEALRVVNPAITPEIFAEQVENNLLTKVYKLIWERTIAAVMPPALYENISYIVNNNQHQFNLTCKGLITPGYLILQNEPQLTLKLPFKENEEIKGTIEVFKKFTEAKPRYTEATLIRELRDLGICRPSTYESIIEILLSDTRGYTRVENKEIIPTERGVQLAHYCDRSFPKIINVRYTKDMEEALDKIAKGKISWLDYMQIFFTDLEKTINQTNETGIAPELPEKLCPICNSPMIIRRSRFGKLFYGCSRFPECKGILNV